jgi:hypothetical protein
MEIQRQKSLDLAIDSAPQSSVTVRRVFPDDPEAEKRQISGFFGG